MLVCEIIVLRKAPKSISVQQTKSWTLGDLCSLKNNSFVKLYLTKLKYEEQLSKIFPAVKNSLHISFLVYFPGCFVHK